MRMHTITLLLWGMSVLTSACAPAPTKTEPLTPTTLPTKDSAPAPETAAPATAVPATAVPAPSQRSSFSCDETSCRCYGEADCYRMGRLNICDGKLDCTIEPGACVCKSK